MNAVATTQPTSKVSPSDSNPSPPSGRTTSASDSSAATASNQTSSTTPRSNSACCSYRPCFLPGVQARLENCSTEGCTSKAHVCCQLGYRTIKQVVECNIMPPRRCGVCEDEHLSTSQLSWSSPLGSKSKNTEISDSDSDSKLPRRLDLTFSARTQAMQKNR